MMNEGQLQLLTRFLDEAATGDVEASAEFALPDPLSPTHDLFIGNAEFPEETYWIICRRHAGNHAYLGRGRGRNYVECCFFGCPERVRQDCILDREAVLEFASMLSSIDNLQEPWHWVTFDDIYA
jgi:hypothetical protein